jgi:hypothetical protein
MMERHKVCPLAAAHSQQENSDCLGEECACYVKMHKPCLMQTDQSKMIDSEFFYRYKGCGLVTHVPWELVKREENPATTEPKPPN